MGNTFEHAYFNVIKYVTYYVYMAMFVHVAIVMLYIYIELGVNT